MTKLKNIEAVQKMLNNEHWRQTKTHVSFQDIKKSRKKKRKIGDTWIDAEGKLCTQKDGYVVRTSKNSILDEISDYLHIPAYCPICKREMKHQLDKKFWRSRKLCFECNINFEGYLRIKKKYEQFEKMIILDNQISYLKDTKDRLESYLKWDGSKSIVNKDGTFEKWVDDPKIRSMCAEALKECTESILKLEKKVSDNPLNIKGLIQEWKQAYKLDTEVVQ